MIIVNTEAAGGEIRDYTKMMAESREHALDRMIAEAEALGELTRSSTSVFRLQ